VIAAAGDIACDPSNSNFNGGQGKSGACQQLATATVLQQINPVAVLALGDNQYYCGGYQAFLNSYALSWGQLLSKTYPSVGNHEYLTSGGTGCDSSNQNAAGYWRYYAGAADEGNAGQGWYSFDVGSWHLIALNSNCSQAGGCGTGSPQYNWLAADLAAHPHQCLLAYWHIPLFSSGGRANQNSHSFWNLLYAAHADVVLNGHDHIYERFARRRRPASRTPRPAFASSSPAPAARTTPRSSRPLRTARSALRRPSVYSS
jgi:Predicted phosphohydrolases